MKLVAIALMAVACAPPPNRELEAKVDNLAAQLAANQRVLDAVQKELEAFAAKPAPAAKPAELPTEQKLDRLERKIDALALANPPAPGPTRPQADRASTYAIAVDGHPTEGPADAKVTIVLAYDYADPYTNKSRPVLVDLRKKYGADLRIVYRSFVVHPQTATAGALAACAAAKQKKFAAYDALLWDKAYVARSFDVDVASTKCWHRPEGCPVTLGYARDLHLDVDRFRTDMKACEPELFADMGELAKFAVGATPTFFINGRVLTGAMPIDDFVALIDEELAKANERIHTGSPRATYYKDWVLAKGLTRVGP